MTPAEVERIFTQLVRRAREAGALSLPVSLKWGVPADFPTPRDHAYASATEITVAPRMATAPRGRVLGVMAHELGHVMALQRNLQHSEIEADALGAALLGRSIGYDALDVQHAGRRRPRPRRLHQ